MMGVYIKGMEMPTGDEMLCINIFSNGNVTNHFDLRCMPVATAVPVPPHGRLIDADTIGLTNFEIILCKQEQEPYKEALKMILDKIEKSPTIILKDQREAEE